MRDPLLALSSTFQKGFKIRICNHETVKLTHWGDETKGRQEKRFCVV